MDPLIGVVGFVSNQLPCFHRGKKPVCPEEIVGLAARETKSDRIAKGVHQSMDLRAQPPSGPPDCLIFSLFFLAPALC
jgi:hypothetical protein